MGRKTLDSSTFIFGTVIPTRYRSLFLENLSKELTKGEQVPILININNKNFEASIDYPNLNRKDSVIRFRFSKKLREYISKELFISYDYIMNMKNKNNKGKNIKLPEEYKEYMDFYKGSEKDRFIVKLVKSGQDNIDETFEEDEDVIGEIDSEEDENTDIITEITSKDAVYNIYNFITSQGYTYDKSLINNLYVSLKTKPFVILSGISGTGKSKIVELFAKALGATTENKRFNLVPVKPDWTDSTDLLGYRNIEGHFNPGIVTEVCYNAITHPEVPYFLCLDEMNLARVEYYFSDILSLMETRKLNESGEIVTDKILKETQIGNDADSFIKYGDIYIPENLYIIGTMNMDETTFPFSKKVLDRANTIEFNKVNLKYNFDFEDDESENEKMQPIVYHNNLLKSEFLKIKECREYKDIAQKVIDKLIAINDVLEKYNNHFGYRVRDEIVFYMIYAVRDNILSFGEALDNCIVQKVLPKISGSSDETQKLLISLFELLNDYKFEDKNYIDENEINKMKKVAKERIENISEDYCSYKYTNEKIIYMIWRFARDGFTTFWK